MAKSKEINRRRRHITKNPTNNIGVPIIPKYEAYRITDEGFIDKANDKWKEIIKEGD